MENQGEGLLEGETTGVIIGLFYRVYHKLGFGFLESVYCRALAYEFQKAGLEFVREAPIEVFYDGQPMGQYRRDFLVARRVVVEVKACEFLTDGHRDQLRNLLAASRIEVGLLLHFGPKARFERAYHSNSRKP